MELTQTNKVLYDFSIELTKLAKQNLADTRDTGNLHDSIDVEYDINLNDIMVSIVMEDYGDYVNEGVRGKGSNERGGSAPYRFGSGSGKKGGLTSAINDYVKRNRIQFRNEKTGKYTTYEQTAFLITRSIWNKGIEPTDFLTDALNELAPKFENDLANAYGDDVIAHILN